MPEISRRQFLIYAVAVVLVVLLGGRALRADAGAGSLPASAPGGAEAVVGEPGTGATGSGGVAVSEPPDEDGEGKAVTVHVAGAVRRAGVYVLPTGTRVADAIRKAGGARPHADLDALNLAAKLVDAQQVLVPRRSVAGAGGPATSGGSMAGGDAAGAGGASGRGAGGTGSGGAAASGGAGATAAGAGSGAPVAINTATLEQLDALPGVGPAIAQKIIDYRTQHGPFKTVDDLLQVSGIGPKTLEDMRAQVQV